MEKGDGDGLPDDGIVSEDLTQLVEHIELTSAHRLPDTHDWELVAPAADLDDAPILIGTLPDEPGIAGMELADDTQMFLETQADIAQLLPAGERRAHQAAALAAERARWQKRVDTLERALAERNQLLAERERRIEELQARLATRTLEREGLAEELRDARPINAAVTDAVPPAEAPAEAAGAEADYTQELPVPGLPLAPPVASVPRLRRYLIGLDVVGCVHEIAGRRVNIGRTRDNDLRIVDPTVSRLHAMLTVRNGEAMLVDANSRNGIFVNGIQVRYARLDDGDLVTFGTVRFRYRIGSDAAGSSGGSA
jgi:pSer/pThr/pTyr-binding forkhead associated (FHA) protein